jgi:TnpA family transposase
MPHRELLTESQRLSLQAPASDERGMVRHYTLSSEDLALINRRRGDPNRLGFALMLCYLRFPGDGLLYHQSSLVINEHYTDTGGFSDHVFAMCRLLGFRFAPRIRDLKEKRLYILPGMTVPPDLASLVAGAIIFASLVIIGSNCCASPCRSKRERSPLR